jgi:hypothetical protein
MSRRWKSVIGGISALVIVASHASAEGLPDILGIQLGMPARDAHAKLQAQLPKNAIQIMSTNLPTIEKSVITSFQSAPKQQIAMGDEGDQVSVDVTLPPNQQAVWKVVRDHSFPNKGIPKTTLLASLREKYGKEALTNVVQGRPAADDSHIISLLWLFDEQGHPASVPIPPGKNWPDLAMTLNLSTCMNGPESLQLGPIEVYAESYKGKNPQLDWCYKSFTAVIAGLVESNPPELYSHMRVMSISYPLALRASEATLKWKKDIAAGQHKRDLEKAGQQGKPKL